MQQRYLVSICPFDGKYRHSGMVNKAIKTNNNEEDRNSMVNGYLVYGGCFNKRRAGALLIFR